MATMIDGVGAKYNYVHLIHPSLHTSGTETTRVCYNAYEIRDCPYLLKTWGNIKFFMNTKSDRTLESLKFFPVLAWALFLLFAAFVYTLTYQLKQVTVAITSNSEASFQMSEGIPSPSTTPTKIVPAAE